MEVLHTSQSPQILTNLELKVVLDEKKKRDKEHLANPLVQNRKGHWNSRTTSTFDKLTTSYLNSTLPQQMGKQKRLEGDRATRVAMNIQEVMMRLLEEPWKLKKEEVREIDQSTGKSSDEWEVTKQTELIDILKGIGEERRDEMIVDDLAPKKGRK
ncbi:hypothetical protein TrRE_jg4648 [Triparma retinervis]|uniref:Uncharacterized protein n=1 Tax=Triparma retinervis TaxID=2557542 RepID=A0A9W7A6W5_9STRA|nr:hypothetical protein TrRE_jg4648 [Triparma retinervis]